MNDPNFPAEGNTNPVPVDVSASTAVPVPAPTAVPETSSVIVPASGGAIPGWFYFIFGATLIIFFIVTTLLVLQITQKQPANQAALPSPYLTTTKLPSPTLLPTDSAAAKLNETGNSDEIASIEADLKNTDLEVWDQGLTAVEAQVNNSL